MELDFNARSIEQTEPVVDTVENHLTSAESSELTSLEMTIERGLKVFWEVGNALLSIRDKRLYRSTHSTFEDYCAERWDFTDERARLLMRGSEVVTNIQQTPTIVGVLPTNENQVRELAKLTPDQQRIAWQEAVNTAPNGKVTGSHVKAIAQKYKSQTMSANTGLRRTTRQQPSSVAAELAVQGELLGLPTKGDSVLPESDVMDELTHTSPADVDDRLGAFPSDGAIARSVRSMLPEFEADNRKFLISDELTRLREENLCLSQKLEKLETARLEDTRKFTEFHQEVQLEIVRLNRENYQLQKLVESLQAENQTLKQQLEAMPASLACPFGLTLDQFQQPAVSTQDLTTPVLTKPSIKLGDTVAAAEPSSLAYHWKGKVVRMHESNPDLVYVRYPERLDPTKMKGIKTKQDTITCRIDSLRRIGAGNG